MVEDWPDARGMTSRGGSKGVSGSLSVPRC